MRTILRDLWDILTAADRREAIILLYAAAAMLAFVALSNGGAHAVFEELYAARFGLTYLDNPDYHWWKITFFHTGVLVACGLIPIILVKLALAEKFSDFGLCLGDWRWGLKFLALWCIVMGPGTYFSTNDAAFLQEYPLAHADVTAFAVPVMGVWFLIYLMYYIGWEFLFRGWLLFGMEKKFGAFGAILLQTIPSTVIHIGKPLGETAAAFPGGLILGAVTLRTRSILWPLVAHWYLGILTELFTSLHRTW